MPIQICIDSTLGSQELSNYENITVLPLYLIIDGTEYRDGIDISADQLFAYQRAGKTITTSQISAGQYLAEFETQRDRGCSDLYVFTLAQTISGTYQSAVQAKEMVTGIHVHIVDTGLTGACSGSQVLDIMAYGENHSSEEICSYAHQLFSKVSIVAYVATLDYLVRGGRLSKVSASLANFLNIKPILSFSAFQEIKVIDKQRTLKKTFERLFQEIAERKPTMVYINHSDESNEPLLTDFTEKLAQRFPDVERRQTQLCSVLGVHIGPDAVVIMMK